MPEYTQTLCSEMEYLALLELDRVIRIAMSVPNTGEFLVIALQALDQVRVDQGLPIPQKIENSSPPVRSGQEASDLAKKLIGRAMKGNGL